MIETLAIEPFQAAHLEEAHALSQAVQWPHRIEDWGMLLDIGDGVVALEQGRVIGTAMTARFGADLSVAFMIIVNGAHQGKGIGRKLMQASLPQTGTCRLVATAEGLPLYEKLAFKSSGQIVQLQGHLQTPPSMGDARPARKDDLDAIVTLGNADYGADRSRLSHWLAQNGTMFVTEGEDGHINGYAARRPFGRGQVIGPVVAQDVSAAKTLISAAAHGQDGQFTRIDTDAVSGLVPWIETLGLSRVGGGVAMQRGDGPAARPRFALFSQALG